MLINRSDGRRLPFIQKILIRKFNLPIPFHKNIEGEENEAE
jgi:hypothetical protein